ncbi:MAG: hypothetical protein IPO83_05325 [Chitinophagaceae bacterium]|nr:hypothetical protein [Chitinophagaceae bacterium]
MSCLRKYGQRSRIYTDTIFTITACDTIVITDLTVHQALVDSVSIQGITCNGSSEATALFFIPLSGLSP